MIRCGRPFTSTGPGPVSSLLRRHPRLTLVIAHLGAPEYAEFLDLAERYERVHLDTTMFATDFTERLAPYPPSLLPRLAALLGTGTYRGAPFPKHAVLPVEKAHFDRSLFLATVDVLVPKLYLGTRGGGSSAPPLDVKATRLRRQF